MEENAFPFDSEPQSIPQEGSIITQTLLVMEALFEADNWRSDIRDYTLLLMHVNQMLPYLDFMLDSEGEYFKNIYAAVAEFQNELRNS
jgi:hypothetical protein